MWFDYSVFSIETLPVSQANFSEFREETFKDMELTILQDTVLNGWRENKKQINPRVTHYWTYFDGLMLKGGKVIIPKSMQKSILGRYTRKVIWV